MRFKLKIFFWIFFIAQFAKSQITILHDGEVKNSGDTITFLSAEYPIVSTIYAENIRILNSSNAIQEVIVERTELEINNEAETQICWTGYCYGPFVNVTPISASLEPGEEEQTFSGYFLPYGIHGISFVKFNFLDTISLTQSNFIAKFVVEDITQVKKISEEHVEVYPNPFTNSIQLNKLPNNSKLVVSNMKGEIVFQSNKSTLDLSQLESGLYFLTINQKRTIKIVKQ